MTYKDLEKINESLKTTDIKGKNYAEVNQRIKGFRQLFPEGFILTRIESLDNGVVIITAEVGKYEEGQKIVLATGTAYEKEGSTFINKTSYIENCETSAVGRALGMLGIGVDTSVASFEEVGNAIIQQEADKKITKNMYDTIISMMEKKGVSEKQITDRYKKALKELTISDFRSLMDSFEKTPDKE